MRQLPTTAAIAVAVASYALTVDLRHPVLMVTAVALTAAVQAVALLPAWERWPGWCRFLLPLAQMVAIGLVDAGAGARLASPAVLLFLPAVSLALRPGIAALVCALAGSALALVAPLVADIERPYAVLWAVVTLLIIAVVTLTVQAVAAAERARSRDLARARDDLAAGARRLRDSRDTLRSIFQAATEQALVATDDQGVVLLVNTGAERILAREPGQLVGRRITEILPGDPARTVSLPELLGAAADGGSHSAAWSVLLPDGTERDLEVVVTARPELSGSGPDLPAGYLVVATDLTARREEEQQQDAFIGMVSHELRTPLMSILGYVELLELGPGELDPDQREYLEVIGRNATRLQRLVEDLLLSAQLAHGIPMVAEELDVVDVVRSTVGAELPAARAAGVELRVVGDASVPLVSDAQRLSQVVDNLLSNAIKYSPDGGEVEVAVTRTQDDGGGRQALIRVTDHGVGIAPDEVGRLTERFYRSRDTRRRRVRGVGLGLALVQAVVSEHRGSLTIDSEPGIGTRVSVVLPDLRPPAPAPDGTETG